MLFTISEKKIYELFKTIYNFEIEYDISILFLKYSNNNNFCNSFCLLGNIKTLGKKNRNFNQTTEFLY